MGALLEARGVSKRFEQRLDLVGRLAARLGSKRRDVVVHALQGIDLAVARGEVVGLVGESGCGKSTLGRVLAGVMPPSEGSVAYEGHDRASLGRREARRARLDVQMIFQDPMSSLNPRMRVRDIIMQGPVHHGLVRRQDAADRLRDVLGRVGLDPAYADRYPHQFSGGQRARVGIARALAVEPKVLVCDESVAALDVSIQAQVLNLFLSLRRDLGLTYLFISHDLGVVRHLADRVAVMYLGRVVEEAPTAALYARPAHPYASALLAEAPRVVAGRRVFSAVKGEIPSPLAPPPGCHFHPRCPAAGERCRVEVPVLRPVAAGHRAACHLHDGGVGAPLS